MDLNPELLPSSLARLTNWPYRSLAWAVRNNGGYGQTNESFADFLWAQFFEEHQLLASGTISDVGSMTRHASAASGASGSLHSSYCTVAPWDPNLCFLDGFDQIMRVLGQALTLAQSEAAAALPGYGQGEIDYPKCGNDSVTSTSPTASLRGSQLAA